MTLFSALLGQCADDVVGLETFGLQDGNAKGLERPADEGQLLSQVRGHLGPVCFVTTVVDLIKGLGFDVPLLHRGHAARALIAKNRTAYVEDGSKILPLKKTGQLLLFS